MKKFDYAKNKADKKRIPIVQVHDVYFYPWGIPFIPLYLLIEYIKNKRYQALVWSEEKATTVLDHWLPHMIEWVKEDNAYYFSTDWHFNSYNIAKKVPLKLKRWAKKFGGYELKNFLVEKYQNKEYNKTIEKDSFGDIWIKFVVKN